MSQKTSSEKDATKVLSVDMRALLFFASWLPIPIAIGAIGISCNITLLTQPLFFSQSEPLYTLLEHLLLIFYKSFNDRLHDRNSLNETRNAAATQIAALKKYREVLLSSITCYNYIDSRVGWRKKKGRNLVTLTFHQAEILFLVSNCRQMISVDACEPYFEYMRKSAKLDSDMMQFVAAHVSEITFPPKHIILQEGSICNKVYFIVSGTARSFYIDPSGVTVTWAFLFNNNKSIGRNLFAVDYRAFLTNTPSSIAIETLTEVHAIIFTREKLDFLMENSPQYETFMRKLNERAYLGMFDRAFTLLTMSATERYCKLIEDEPHLMQMFSNHYIASYLGIAPQSLSRIRSQH